MQPSQQHFHVSGREIANRKAENKPLFTMDKNDVSAYEQLAALGVGLDAKFVQSAANWAMDDAQGGVFTPSVGTPVQFLQAWLPGFVRAVFAVRKIDELTGISTIGNWEDEEVVQGVLENMGDAVPYGDFTNIPFANWNANYERRTIVAFELGFKIARRQELRAAAQRISSANENRVSVSQALDIQRNIVGFNGYNDGTNRTYGFLNDPSLPAYVNVANGVGGTSTWASKTYLEITADIRVAMAKLQTQSQGNVDPQDTPTVLAVPTGTYQYLTTTTSYGTETVLEWLKKNYPKNRVVSAPQLEAANGGANVFYLYAEEISDGATDDSRVWVQAVPAKFQTLGVEQGAKSYVEDFTNATAGVMLKRPYAVVRYSGI